MDAQSATLTQHGLRAPVVIDQSSTGHINHAPDPRVPSVDRTAWVGDAITVITLILATATQAIAFSALVFSGPAAAGLPRAVGSFVVAGGVMGLWIAVRGGVVPVATIVQDGPALVAAMVITSFVGRGAEVTDVFVLLALTTLLSGVLLWLLGRFQLGGLARYIPPTVVNAFLAGTGWLLFKGGFDVLLDQPLGLSNLGQLVDTQQLMFWVPAFVGGLIAWKVGGSERFPPWSMGVVVIACLALFYLVTVLVSSVDHIESTGWLIGPFPEDSGVGLVTPSDIGDASWTLVFRSLPGVLSVVALTAVALVLNLTGIDAQSSDRVDTNEELRTAGIANIIASPLGATPGFHAIGTTLLLSRLGTTRRGVGAVAGAALVPLGAFGASSIGYIPTLIPGMVLIAIGIDLLHGWIRDMIRSTRQIEAALSIAIVVVIAFFGILTGIAAGIAAAGAIFIVRYCRIDPVWNASTGEALQSQIDRPPTDIALLSERGAQRQVFQLEGYLFFGLLVSFESQLRNVVAESAAPIEFIIVDFDQVIGIDPSSWDLFSKLLADLKAAGVTTVVSSLTGRTRLPDGVQPAPGTPIDASDARPSDAHRRFPSSVVEHVHYIAPH